MDRQQPDRGRGDFPFGDPTEGKFCWVTEFKDESMREFFEKFSELEQDQEVSIIPIMISSYGGEIDVLSAMRDIVKSAGKPVATIAFGKAMSAGAALLACGSPGLRFAARNTSIMIHEMSAGAEGKAEEIKNSAADIARTNKKFMRALASDMGMPYKSLMQELARRKNTDWFLTAHEAKKIGMVDHVGIPRIVSVPASVQIAVPEAVMRAQMKKQGK